eukprot:3459685-Alexandrium_andersonii.AAC.1
MHRTGHRRSLREHFQRGTCTTLTCSVSAAPDPHESNAAPWACAIQQSDLGCPCESIFSHSTASDGRRPQEGSDGPL